MAAKPSIYRGSGTPPPRPSLYHRHIETVDSVDRVEVWDNLVDVDDLKETQS